MQIKQVAFSTSIKEASAYPNDLPEIAFAGKSNVGKSSLLNFIANNFKLAYVSKQPGKTRLINYFLVNNAFYLVDLPGYGFAKVAKSEQEGWDAMMQGFFSVAKQLRALAILMDIRHNPTREDVHMVEYAAAYGIPFVVLATKADKIAKSKRPHAAKLVKDFLLQNVQAEVDFRVIPVSAHDKLGKEAVLAYFDEVLMLGEDA